MRIYLDIKNNTNYRTCDLRKLFIECMKREGVNQCNLSVEKSKRHYVHGKARLNSIRVAMYLPKGSEKHKNSIARVFIHELGHNLGLRHKEMLPIWDIDCSWAEGFDLRTKEIKPKKQRDLVKERYEKTMGKVKEYETKLKRNKTLLKKWNKKLKYYEKKMDCKTGLGKKGDETREFT